MKRPAIAEVRRPLCGAGGGWKLDARSTGSHCGEHASRYWASTSFFATLGFVMCGMEAAQMAATTPMSARKLEAYLFTYTLRRARYRAKMHDLPARGGPPGSVWHNP